MKSKFSDEQATQMLSSLASQFLDWQTKHQGVKNRRYPEELKQRVNEMRCKGISVRQIASQCRVATSAVRGWVSKKKSEPFLRKLKVVPVLAREQVVVVFPSGIRIELASTSQLEGNFLKELSTIGRAN